MEPRLNFILADDHPLFRKALRAIIEKLPASNKVWEAQDGEDVINLLRTKQPDIIFMDYSMPGMNGFKTTEAILQQFPGQKIIVITQYDEIPVILNFFKLGVKGFLAKNAVENEITESIDLVMNGNYYYHSRYEESIGRWLTEGLTKNIPSIKFSKRDMSLIAMLSKGKTSQEISELMGLSIRSVETYRYHLLKSSGVNNTIELLNYVYKNGIAG
jgi:DNA-binding NarL/FixJ family response regulator